MKSWFFAVLAALPAVLSFAGCSQVETDVNADDSRTPAAIVVNQGKTSQPKSRTFELTYGATLKQLPPNAKVRVWLPVPETSDNQTVKIIDSDLPNDARTATDSKYGNRITYFETTTPSTNQITLRQSYRIQRKEVRGLERDGDFKLTDKQRKRFLSANISVPLDGKPLELIKDVAFKKSPIEVARELYNRVDAHVKYDKSKPGYGKGDVLWVCDSRTGNCTDFHSLFISWSRSRNVPAQFQIGFPLPPERGAGKIGGYHCWARFFVENKGWVPVDISEADKHPELKEYYFGNLTENRVTFSTGRDIVLEPKQTGPPLNYFVYPYVEVDGKPLAQENIKLDFSYSDVK